MKRNSGDIFFGATPKGFENARVLRQKSTNAESRLWEQLRNRKLNGFKFRRQHPIQNYIADFYCCDKKLVIEVDGAYHHDPEIMENDLIRTKELNDLGVRVIRFTNEQVIDEMYFVLESILTVINSNP